MKNCIVVCGPTASGKTRIGARIALRLGGEIISCDSRQVYRGMDIGTGKDLSEYRTSRGDVPYHCIDIADPSEIYTVYRFQKDFHRVFKDIVSRGRLPVAVGGTGLYIESVLRGYAIPEAPENRDLRLSLMRKDKEFLERELQRSAPDLYASADRSSKKRIVRSLEIARARQEGGRRPAPARLPAIDPLVFCITWERSTLHERIRARMLARFEQGMVAEVQRLIDAGVPRDRLEMFGMEYRHIGRYLEGGIDYEQMTADLLRDIKRLAKRQETWFRGMERRGVKIHRVKEADEEEAMRIAREYFIENDDSKRSCGRPPR